MRTYFTIYISGMCNIEIQSKYILFSFLSLLPIDENSTCKTLCTPLVNSEKIDISTHENFFFSDNESFNY